MKILNWVKQRLCLLLIVFVSLIFFLVLTYKIDELPGLFIDETNYMNEVISEINFSKDINGLHNPIYFGSVWGQGQSVLYSWLVIPLIKLVGFSILAFRLPMAIISFLAIIGFTIATYLTQKNKFLAFTILVILCTSPWVYISSRWVLDANISPIFVSLGLVLFYFALIIERNKFLVISFSGILIGVSAYGYIASWIYLPFLVSGIFIISLFNKWISLRYLLLWILCLMVVSSPLIVFAYRVNIMHISRVSHLFFFDYPYLPANRTSSLILFDHNIINNVLNNLTTGIKQFFAGTDNLPQNGVAKKGIIFLPLFILGVIGGLFTNQGLNINTIKLKFLCLIASISFIPCAMVIKANFNHWNLVWYPLIVFTAFGFFSLINRLNLLLDTKLAFILLGIPIASFISFTVFSYFGVNGNETFFNSSDGSYSETYKIDAMMKNEYRGKKLFLNGLYDNFSVFRLVEKPIDRKSYLRKQETDKDLIGISPLLKYGYLRDFQDLYEAKKGDLAIRSKFDQIDSFKIDNGWKCIDILKFNHNYVNLYEKIF